MLDYLIKFWIYCCDRMLSKQEWIKNCLLDKSRCKKKKKKSVHVCFGFFLFAVLFELIWDWRRHPNHLPIPISSGALFTFSETSNWRTCKWKDSDKIKSSPQVQSCHLLHSGPGEQSKHLHVCRQIVRLLPLWLFHWTWISLKLRDAQSLTPILRPDRSRAFGEVWDGERRLIPVPAAR